ncbi:MAG: hypothetical protein K2N41_01520 [Lachnospiraceae bacterium]|nr:hypothetical protein [Lachnospiraceae bacterium]MDE7238375.1 hypothetical protein [Lachnospiraceae bacterium]
MESRKKDASRQFAQKLLDDIKSGRIEKDCPVNHSDDFTGGMEKLHEKRFHMYLSSCGCYLMDRRLDESEEGYCG